MNQIHSNLTKGGCGGMVDATDLKSVGLWLVRVRLPPPVYQRVMRILAEESCLYSLTEKEGGVLWMEVESGTTAVFTVGFPLNSAEQAAFLERREAFLHELAFQVIDAPDAFRSR